MAERHRVCLAEAGNVVCCAVVWRRADDGQACCVVDAFLDGECLERSKSLVVIHGENGIEIVVGSAAEESVGGIGTEGLYAVFFQFVDGGDDDVVLLVAYDSVVACMRVEREYGDAW